MHNFTYWHEHLMELSLQGYINVVSFFFWPIIFSTVIAYVYLKQQSAVAAAVAALIIFAAFSNYLLNVDTWVSFMYILVALVIAMLVLVFLSKRRN